MANGLTVGHASEGAASAKGVEAGLAEAAGPHLTREAAALRASEVPSSPGLPRADSRGAVVPSTQLLGPGS